MASGGPVGSDGDLRSRVRAAGGRAGCSEQLWLDPTGLEPGGVTHITIFFG